MNKSIVIPIVVVFAFIAVMILREQHINSQKPKFECMRMYYAGMDIESCSKNVHCSISEDETGTIKICQMDKGE